MSHFSVLIVGEVIDQQLAPYDENLEVEPYKNRVGREDLDRFVRFYSNPSPEREYEIKGVERAKELGFHPITEATVRGAWAALSENWNGSRGGWDQEGPFEWSTYNPKSRWDYWRIGGRWGGHWKLKPGRAGHTDPIAWELTFNDPDNRIAADRCDQARKGDIDFEAIEREEAAKAVADWALWEPILKEFGVGVSWTEMVARVDAGELAIDEASNAYDAQPQVAALKKAFPRTWDLKPEDFGANREEYIATRAQRIWVPYAFVRDGEWHEKGRMGWWGMSSDGPEDQKPWTVEVRSIVLNLPDSELLTVVDAHI